MGFESLELGSDLRGHGYGTWSCLFGKSWLGAIDRQIAGAWKMDGGVGIVGDVVEMPRS